LHLTTDFCSNGEKSCQTFAPTVLPQKSAVDSSKVDAFACVFTVYFRRKVHITWTSSVTQEAGKCVLIIQHIGKISMSS